MSEDKLKAKLKEVLDEYDLVGLIYADIDGKNTVRIGELETLPETGLVQILFGGESEIKNLYDSLEGKILPQGWGQGKVRTYVDVTKNNKIFGVFHILTEGRKFEDLERKRIFIEKIRNVLEGFVM